MMWTTPMSGANIDFPALLRNLELTEERILAKALDFRKWASGGNLPPGVQILDVDFDRLTKTPLLVAEDIYKATGRTFDDEARARISEWVVEHEKHRRDTPRHSHELETW